MKSLLKVMLVLALFFASTFIVLKATGVITVEKIEGWLALAHSANPLWVAAIVSGLLFADLLVAVPTLTVIILGGYFLGAIVGAAAAISGLVLAGTCGYFLSRRFGHLLIRFLIKQQDKRDEAITLFQQHGPVVILLSRATPIWPEVSACMAGMTGMPFVRFLLLWLVSAVPYAAIAAYAGSVSTVENPGPAIYAAIGLTGIFWLGWLVFRRIQKTGRIEV